MGIASSSSTRNGNMIQQPSRVFNSKDAQTEMQRGFEQFNASLNADIIEQSQNAISRAMNTQALPVPKPAGGEGSGGKYTALERNVTALKQVGHELVAYNKIYRQLLQAKLQSQEQSVNRVVGHLQKQNGQLISALNEVRMLERSNTGARAITVSSLMRWMALIGDNCQVSAEVHAQSEHHRNCYTKSLLSDAH